MDTSALVSRDDEVVGVDRGAQVTGVACAALFCPWVAVSARFYVRLGIQKMFGKEDYLTLVSLLVITVLCALLLGPVTRYGLGAHMENISHAYLDDLSAYMFACEILYIFTTALTKLSIGFYFMRLTNKPVQRLIIYGTMITVVIVSFLYLLFTILQCHPVRYLWTQFSHGNGHCQSKTVIANVTYAHAAMSAVTDCIFGIMPILFVWHLRMDPRTKFSVIIILSLGFFASTATIVRLYYIHSLESTTDYSWEGINLVKWSIIEPAIALTAAAFATLRPLSQKFFPSSSNSHRPLQLTSTPSSTNIHNRNNKRYSGESYNSEFAAMLGLSTVGVTTEISADPMYGKTGGGMRRSVRLSGASSALWVGVGGLLAGGDTESITELGPLEEGVGSELEGKMLGEEGIMTTTVVTTTLHE